MLGRSARSFDFPSSFSPARFSRSLSSPRLPYIIPIDNFNDALSPSRAASRPVSRSSKSCLISEIRVSHTIFLYTFHCLLFWAIPTQGITTYLHRLISRPFPPRQGKQRKRTQPVSVWPVQSTLRPNCPTLLLFGAAPNYPFGRGGGLSGVMAGWRKGSLVV